MYKVSIITGSNSRNSGGLFNSVKELSAELSNNINYDIKVFSHNDEYSQIDLDTWYNIPMEIYKIKGSSNFSFTFDLKQKLKEYSPDIIHQQWIWGYPSKIAYVHKKKNNSKNIISPRGMLDSWAVNNSKLKKKLVGYWYEYDNLKEADCIHALCDSEYHSIREFGLKNPVAIIPNGVKTKDIKIKNISNGKKKTLLFIGRIHPKKGLVLLLEALKLLKNDNSFISNWQLVIAGWDQNGHLNDLKDLVINYGLSNIVNFPGPLYKDAKKSALLKADAFILPSWSEGLPMSLLEAWSYRLPVLMTKECNIPEGFESKAALELKLDANHIATQLKKLDMVSPEELSEMSNNGFNLVSSKFSWEKIATQTIELYNWLLKKGNKPSFVKLD